MWFLYAKHLQHKLYNEKGTFPLRIKECIFKVVHESLAMYLSLVLWQPREEILNFCFGKVMAYDYI